MILTSILPPPASKTPPTNPVHQPMDTGLPAVVAADTSVQQQPLQPGIPHVLLQAPSITHSMAASLAMSLLGHVLFLKSQVPFPMVQLAHMPDTQSGSKSAKRRAELLASIDTLTSHMHTTFSALSTALARCRKREPSSEVGPLLAGAHLIFALGPSVASAKIKVVLVLNGLEVKIWGKRDDLLGAGLSTRDAGKENLGELHDDDNDDDSSDAGSNEESLEDSDSDDAEDSGTDSEDEESVSDSNPPLSRTPSPSPPISPPRSLSLSPAKDNPMVNTAKAPSALLRSEPTYSQTFAEEQAALRAAERLLSRTLASACAEDGGGMSCELPPTQTHVMLRAPRRFAHPAWIPRQNLTRTLESVLQSFLEDARGSQMNKTAKKRVKPEGVWVGCRDIDIDISLSLVASDGNDDDEMFEEDEMIWWSWDGKIVGFADW